MKPAYQRIKEELENQMESGELQEGQRLPSEVEMARRFAVSRETFRAAVRKLEEEGKVRIRHGVGTFVIRPLDPIPSSIDRLSSTSEMIQTAGLQEGQHQESIRREACQTEWAEFLKIRPGDPVIVSERMRKANGEPISFNINIMPYSFVGDVFQMNTLRGSLMRFLEENCGIRIVSANTELVVPLQTDANCQKLRVNPNTTVILLKQIHFDSSHLPVLFSYDYFRNDVFKFWIQRTR
ncbi:GntR family transcriptional regulator [Ferviditalea candida]|uniref:GntR family transcriptional regulator n=1 Tax=Ferviditalea candida TaxID=3108399 RepID=A0ABU5ZEE3_9BACL|nr:GntR family transcriptional regulator [Paenibacillaceae bacterium T2]